MKKLLSVIVSVIVSVTLSAQTSPVQHFTTKDTNGREVKSKFTTTGFTIRYNQDPTDLTFKLNGIVKDYDKEAGLTVEGKIGSKTNDVYTISVFKGDEALDSVSYTYIPTANTSTYKTLADGTEAILSLSAGNKVTYVNNSNAYLEDSSRGILAYSTGLTFQAYKQLAASSVWGKKTTYNNVVEITSCDSTSACSSLTQTDADVTPTGLTVAQTLLDINQLRYVKVTGVKITKDENNDYYALSGQDQILLYDKFNTTLLATLASVPCFADVTGIVTTSSTGVKQLCPTALDNVSDKITGTCGSVTWTIDMQGNMAFAPTEGESGTLAQTGISATKRPWASVATSIRTIRFASGVNAYSDNSYMFKDMTNLTSVDFTNFNTSNLTTMKGMFTGCTSLKSVDMSMLDLAKVTTLNLTFNGCSALEGVNLGDNTLAAVTDFTSTFYSCHALKSLDFGKVTGAAVTKMPTMLYGCTALGTVDFSSFSTAKVSSVKNATNVFGSGTYAALPDTMYLSKDFGLIATEDYVALPAKKYMTLRENGVRIKEKDFNLAEGTDGLYAYNATTSSHGTYVTFRMYGDANGDNIIDVADITAILSVMYDTKGYSANADVNCDGTIDVSDITATLDIMFQ